MSRDATEKSQKPSASGGTPPSVKPSTPPPPPVPAPPTPETSTKPAPASFPSSQKKGSGSTGTARVPVAAAIAADAPGKATTEAAKDSTPSRVPVAAAAAATPASETPKTPKAASARPVTPTVTAASKEAKKAATGPRRVRLAVSRVDPWSIMKLSFLLSIAIGIMIVVGAAVFWMVLDSMQVFTEIDDLIQQVVGTESEVNFMQYMEFKQMLSLSTMVAVADIVILTALSTIGAFLYNVVAALVGGVHLTLIDE